METNRLGLEFKMSDFFEMTPDLVCIAGRNGFFKKVNRSVMEKLGYTEKELMSSPISSFIHPEDKQFTAHRREELINGKPLLNFQNRYVAKTGAILWLEWTSIYFSDNEVVFAIAKDITERKQIEIEIEENYRKFKNLTSHFKSSMEEDRKSLANALHEELAQLASVLKMDIEWMKSHTSEVSPAYQSKIEHAFVASQLLIKTIRRISFSISPNMLEHLGLNATLEWYCKASLTDEIKIDLFRICQEALTNILNHAQAGHVKIKIAEVGDRIELTIFDDGKGFDVDHQKLKPGLVRMRERAASINGELSIQSGVGMGTSVCVSVKKQ